MILFGSTENEITKDQNDENAPHFKIAKVIIAHCSIVNDDYQ